MFFFKHLNPFIIYIVLLIITSSIFVNAVIYFPIINSIAYSFIHFLLIYIVIYYFNKFVYFIYFFLGIILDIFLLNEIGPHLITFMLLLIILNISSVKKIFIKLNTQNIFLVILSILIISLLSEIFISFLLYDYKFDHTNLFKHIIISLIISYPSFYFFSRIDRLG